MFFVHSDRFPFLVRFLGFLGLVGLLGPAISLAQTHEKVPPLEKVTTVEGITQYQLANGVKVLLFPDDSKPQFTVNMTVRVGSRHEGYGESGMAHLLEHMLFRGTDLFPDIPKLLKDRGVLNMNGTTSFDRTNYFETLPSLGDNLEFAISMEADRLVHSWIKQEHLDAEMTIVRSEFERGENSPQRMVLQRLMAAAYLWHNYGKSTIGNRSDIMRVPASRLRVFYRKYYQPDNVTLLVAGNFDQEQALRLIKEKFGAIPRPKRKLPQTYTEEPPQDGERSTILRRSGDVQVTGIGYHVPAAGHPDYASIQVLATLMSMEPSGHLYRSLVEPKLATSAMAIPMVGHDPGMLIAMAEVPTDIELERVKQILAEQFESLGEKGVSQEQVDRAVRRILKRREKMFANTERFATELSDWESYGDWRLYFLHRDRLEKVTAESVQAVAKKYLMQSNRTVADFIPTPNPVRARIPQRPDVTKLLADYKGRKAISEGEAFEATPENINRRTQTGQLDSGMQFALLPKETRGDKVILRMNLEYGNADNLKGRVTAADILPQLLMRGTQHLTFQEFQDRLDELKASLSLSGNVGTLRASIETKREHLNEVLELLRQALREPLLKEDQFEIVRRGMKAQYEMGISDPQMLAFVELSRQIDPRPADDVRYTPTVKETLERLDAVTVEDIRSLHHDFLGGEHGQVVVVGDFDVPQTLQKLNSIFANWKSKKPYARIEQPANPKAHSGRIVINTPDKANAVYVSGLTIPMRDDAPDYEAMLIANYIMGGGPLSSRIADRVRKKEGLSYQAVTRFSADPLDPRAHYLTICISNPANTEKVVSTVAEVTQEMIKNGVSLEELQRAKESFLTNRQGRRAQDGKLAGILLTNLRANRTMDYQKQSDQKIAKLSKEQVDAAFRNRVQPQKMIVITAGDFEGTPSSDQSSDQNAPAQEKKQP